MAFHRTVVSGTEVSQNVRVRLDREADALGISFYVDQHLDGDDEEQLHFADGAPELAEEDVNRLREFAVEKGVNLYVHKADIRDEPSPNAIDMGPSSRR